MPDIQHKFTSAISDGGDATLVRPSNWNDDHVWPDAYDQGSLTLADGQYNFQLGRLTVSSTNRLTMAGTARILLFGWFNLPNYVPNVIGQLKQYLRQPFRLPDGYEVYVVNRLTMDGYYTRGTLEGNSDFILSDDFGTRSRIVLAGRG